MMDVEQRPHDAGDKLEEEEESTESLVCTVLAALKKLDEHLQESGDVSLSSYPRRPHVSRFFSTENVFLFRLSRGRYWMRSNICASLRRLSTSSWSEICS